jgi:hypothetical protein
MSSSEHDVTLQDLVELLKRAGNDRLVLMVEAGGKWIPARGIKVVTTGSKFDGEPMRVGIS